MKLLLVEQKCFDKQTTIEIYPSYLIRGHSLYQNFLSRNPTLSELKI